MRGLGDRKQRRLLGGRHRWILSISAVLWVVGLAAAGGSAQGHLNVSGQYGFDVQAIPIPATLVSEIQLDSPAKLTAFKFGIDSLLDLNVDYSGINAHLNTSMSVAGLERCIVEGSLPLGPLVLKPEIWFAAPFETVTDINHLINWVAIPPGGDLMFVTARFTVSGNLGGLDIENLLMLQDVMFPNPGGDFGPLVYTVQSQSFHVGNILTVTTEVYPGVTLRSVTNYFATSSPTSVIGWSARGSVDKESSLCNDFGFTQTLTLSGIKYCGVSLWLSLAVDPCDPEPLVASGGGSINGLWDLDISGAFSLFPLSISGFSFSTSLCDMINMSVQLSDAFEVKSASFRCQAAIDTGIMQGSIYSTCSFTPAAGFSMLTIGSRLTHGTISGALVCSFGNHHGSMRLVSMSPSLSFGFTPISVSVSARFGRTGLVQGLMSVRLVF